MKIHIHILTIISILIPNLCLAVPDISNTSGAFGQGNTVTVTCTAAGTKTTAAPIKFETFENGTIGQSVETDGYWSKRFVADIKFNNNTLRHSNSTKNIKCTFGEPTPDGWFYRNNIGFATTGKAYVNMWMYAEYTAGDASWQLKSWRANSDGDSHGSRPNVTCTPYAYGNDPTREGSRSYQSSADDGTSDKDAITLLDTRDETPPTKIWINCAFAWEASSLDTADGNVYYWTSDSPNGTAIRVDSQLNTLTRTTGINQHINALALGYLMEIGGTEAYSYWDDIYIDNSWARVEIGDNAVYDNCTHREIQIPSSWSDTSIDITVNRGSFPTGSAYLFVVDEDGVASDGYSITIAAGTAPTNVILTTDNQTVSNPSFTIQGTATATSGRTIAGVAIPGETVTPDDGVWDEQVEAWTSNVTLPEGLSSYTATASDGTETGLDSINITYTPVISTISTNSSNSAGCMIR